MEKTKKNINRTTMRTIMKQKNEKQQSYNYKNNEKQQSYRNESNNEKATIEKQWNTMKNNNRTRIKTSNVQKLKTM